jgi:hypothetical protein
MKTFKLLALGVATLGFLAVLGATALAFKAEDKPKYTIKEVMKAAHKDGLKDKVVKGEASKEEKQMLLDLYTALSQNTPKKGDAKEWKDATTPIVEAAKAVVEDKDGAGKKLNMAVNCKNCHTKFK